MKRPSRLVLITASLTVAGLLIGGTAYAMSSQGDAETYRACVNNRTGAIRMLLDRHDGDCYTRRGPWQETLISWDRNGGPAGPAGPPGPRGPRGPGGSGGGGGGGGGGEGSSLGSLDELAGLPCNTDTDDEGVVEVQISRPDQGSVIQMICKTDGTVDWPPPPQPTTPPRPTLTPQPTVEPPRPTTTQRPVPTTTTPPTTTPPRTTTTPPPPPTSRPPSAMGTAAPPPQA